MQDKKNFVDEFQVSSNRCISCFTELTIRNDLRESRETIPLSFVGMREKLEVDNLPEPLVTLSSYVQCSTNKHVICARCYVKTLCNVVDYVAKKTAWCTSIWCSKCKEQSLDVSLIDLQFNETARKFVVGVRSANKPIEMVCNLRCVWHLFNNTL